MEKDKRAFPAPLSKQETDFLQHLAALKTKFDRTKDATVRDAVTFRKEEDLKQAIEDVGALGMDLSSFFEDVELD